jgi:D-glycero-D-manno-heptose 1,7-bisphosphate phosphatase
VPLFRETPFWQHDQKLRFAAAEKQEQMLDISQIDKSWTLFLDRDGVLNHEKKENYILNWGEFRFYEGVKEALKLLNDVFGVIVLVTNQKGIGKGLMTLDDLADIHSKMMGEIRAGGGRIDKLYFCADLDNDSYYRKPNPGMAETAKQDFPAIDMKRSIIAGNKLSDMRFGRNTGMYTAYIATTNPEVDTNDPLVDVRFNNLLEFAVALTRKS